MTSETLAGLSNTLLYAAMAVYALAMTAFSAELAFTGRIARRRAAEVPQRELATVGGGPTATVAAVPASDPSARAAAYGRVAVSLTVLAFALHGVSVLARGLSAARVPWGNMFEFSVTGALAVTGAYLVLLSRRDLRHLGTFVVLPVLLTLGLAVTVLYTESAQLVPALKSVWLVIHVLAAIVASGIFTVAFAQTVVFLAQDRRERRGAPASFLDRLPGAEALDRSAYRMHAFAYPIWTFAVIAGAIWAENAWGRYWGWDPKEVWAFVTWIVYTTYLHARATAGWKGRKAAYIALVGYATFLFNYFVVNIWLVGFHSYSGL